MIAALAAVPLLLSTGCGDLVSDEPIETRDDKFTVSPGVIIDVDSFNGTVEVIGSDTGQVRVQATLKRADKLAYSASQSGNGIQVSANQTEPTTANSPGATIKITAPTSAVLDLPTSNGSIAVTNFSAGARIRTSNGKVSVIGLSGSLDVGTSNGSISVTGLTGAAELDTSNGSISFNGTLTTGSDNTFKTSNGNIAVDVPDGSSLTLDASTSNGSVSSELPITVTSSGKHHLEGVIGSGGPNLNLRTSNGSISLR